MKDQSETLERGQKKSELCQVWVFKDRCKGCGFCIEFCPRKLIHESPEFNHKGYHPVYAGSSDGCLKCSLCELLCPEFAICVVPLKEEDAHG